MAPRPTDRAGAIEAVVKAAQVTSGPGYPIAADYLRERAARMFDRSSRPPRRHATSPRSLRTATAHPARGHHGPDARDPRHRGSTGAGRGRARHREVDPGAELVEIEGLGHGIPPALWTRLADLVAAHTQKAEAARV